MVEKCAKCGTTENIQEHHVSYEPEIKQFLCVDCHMAVHNYNHGVGNPKGWDTVLFETLKTDAEILFKAGATNGEVSKACNISYATASHWRRKFGLEVKKYLNQQRNQGTKRVFNIGVGKKGEVFWETNFPTNGRIRIPTRAQQLSGHKKGEKIKVFIGKVKSNRK